MRSEGRLIGGFGPFLRRGRDLWSAAHSNSSESAANLTPAGWKGTNTCPAVEGTMKDGVRQNTPHPVGNTTRFSSEPWP
jgi:hypothetical protein